MTNKLMIASLVFLAFLASEADAQDMDIPIKPAAMEQVMTIHSPEVGSIGKFAMSPPSYSNGLPSQNIPLYNLQENGLSYPVELSYSYSGCRPREYANAAGLGWSVSEGVISRIVRGLPDGTAYKDFDEFNYDNLEPEEIIHQPKFTGGMLYDYNVTANRFVNKKYDYQPDEYVFSFNGYSGKFYWLDNKAIIYPHTDIQITRDPSDIYQGYFTIATPDGQEYTFQKMDHTTGMYHWSERLSGFTSEDEAMSCGEQALDVYGNGDYPTAWRLQKIVNKNTKSEIDFQYSSYFEQHTMEGSEINSVTFWTDDVTVGGFAHKTPNIDPHPGYIQTENFYLTKIISDHFTVDYKYQTRADHPAAPALDSIIVYNKIKPTSPIKTVNFDFNTGTASFTLKNLFVYGQGEEKKYGFQYTSTTGNTDIHTTSLDHWGYANGKQNPTLIPKASFITSMESNGSFAASTNYDPFNTWADRSPDFNEAKAFALSEIDYPTGGKTLIEYESAGGRGIRVKSMTDYDTYGAPPISKYYSYFPDNLVTAPSYNTSDYFTEILDWCQNLADASISWTNHHYLTLTSSSFSGLSRFLETQNYYDHVIEYLGSATGSLGRNEYKYTKDLAGSDQVYPTEQSSYDAAGHLVRSTINTYETTLLRTIQFWNDPVLLQPGVSQSCGNFNQSQFCDVSDPLFGYVMTQTSNIALIKGSTKINWWKQIQTVTKDYTSDYSGSFVANTKKSFFNQVIAPNTTPKNTLPYQTEQTRSNGIVEDLNVYYPGDTYSGTTLGIPQMWDVTSSNYKHLAALPVKMIKSINGVKLEELNNSYAYNSANDEINLGQSTLAINNEVINTSLLSYSKGDLITGVTDNNVHSVVLRDYNQQFTTARITNADFSDVAYTSFEGSYQPITVDDVNRGNWNFDKNQISTVSIFNNGKTLKLNPGSGMIESKYPLTAGKKYLLVFWSSYPDGFQVYNGSTLINSTSYIKSTPAYLNIYPITGTDQKVSIKTASTSPTEIYYDEVRLMPENALMKTQTFDNAGNITQSCDERNIITTYDYDWIGRIIMIRDELGHILSTNEYKIQQ